MAHDEPPHNDIRCLPIQLLSSLIGKELTRMSVFAVLIHVKFTSLKNKIWINFKMYVYQLQPNRGRKLLLYCYDNERLCAMESRLRLRRFRPERDSNSGR